MTNRTATGSPSIRLRADRIVTGGSRKTIRDGVVVVEGGRISAVEPASLIGDAGVTAFGDATIIPGLVDAHAHLSLFADSRRYEQMMTEANETMALVALRNLRRHMAAGVTTLRDNGGRDRVTFHVRDAIGRGYFVGPRLLLSGRPVTHSAGHFHFCNGVADGLDAIRRAVRILVAEGADHIKIMASGGATAGNQPYFPSYSVDELRAAVETAHELGRLTTAHCRSRLSMEYALAAGLDCVEHAEFLVAAGPTPLGSGRVPEGKMEYDPRLAERMLESGIFVSFTPQTGGYDTLVRLRRMPKKEVVGVNRERLDYLQRYYDDKLAVLANLIRDGFLPRLVISSDSGPEDTEFGRMRYGMELAVRAGMSPEQAIAAMTTVAAEACGVGHITGSLEVGKEADLVVVKGNLLSDVTCLSDVIAVYRAGSRVDFTSDEGWRDWDPKAADTAGAVESS